MRAVFLASQWRCYGDGSVLCLTFDGRAGSGLRGVAHRAVASQLSPRKTWRHLVPVSTVLTDATEGGSGLQGSAPEAEEEAADAREQEVWGGAVPTNANSLVRSAWIETDTCWIELGLGNYS